jgi:hypothetical protein
MSICREATFLKNDGDRGRAKELRCRTWNTDCCHHLRLQEMQSEIVAGDPTHGFTITLLHAPGRSPVKAAVRMTRCFTRLIRKARRRFKCPIEYFWWREAHQDGWPHGHGGIRAERFYTKEEFRQEWRKLTGAEQIDLDDNTTARALGRYIANYTKDGPEQFGKLRRYSKSRNWRVEPKPPAALFDDIEGPGRRIEKPISYVAEIWYEKPKFYYNRRSGYCSYGVDTS